MDDSSLVLYILAFILFYLVISIVVIYFEAKGKKIQELNYQHLSASLKERGILDAHTGSDYLRPQWEIRLGELLDFSNYNKVVKHLEINIKQESFTEKELRLVLNIRRASRYFAPSRVFSVVTILAIISMFFLLL